MFLLITGASGVGKSTVRKIVESEFADMLEVAEIKDVVDPAELAEVARAGFTVGWRHQVVEKAVERAVQVQREGKHYLFCGDPVPPGEVWAAPSADQLDGLAVCLLDASEEAQRRRLEARGEDPALLPHHVAFAAWMRQHVMNPSHRPDVITQDGWERMQWDRWITRDPRQRPPWNRHIIDTTELDPEQVGALACAWVRRQLGSPTE